MRVWGCLYALSRSGKLKPGYYYVVVAARSKGAAELKITEAAAIAHGGWKIHMMYCKQLKDYERPAARDRRVAHERRAT